MPVEISPSEILIKTEKLEAKIDTINANISTTQDRISRLSEEIGELRSMLIERERRFTNIETEFTKIKDGVADIKPEVISKGIKSFEDRLTKIDAQIERNAAFLTKISDEMKDFRTRMKSIQSLENIADVMKQIQEKSADIEKSKRHASRMAAKAEKMFLELDKRLPELEKSMDRINEMDEITKDLVRITDDLTIRFKTAVHREDLEKLDLEIQDSIKSLEAKMQTGISGTEAKEIDDRIDIPEISEKPDDEIEIGDVSVKEKEMPVPEEVPEIPHPEKNEESKMGKTIPDMINEARGYLKLGGKSTAKQLYDKILVEYKEMETKQPLKAKEYYKEINNLYKELLSQKKA